MDIITRLIGSMTTW